MKWVKKIPFRVEWVTARAKMVCCTTPSCYEGLFYFSFLPLKMHVLSFSSLNIVRRITQSLCFFSLRKENNQVYSHKERERDRSLFCGLVWFAHFSLILSNQMILFAQFFAPWVSKCLHNRLPVFECYFFYNPMCTCL